MFSRPGQSKFFDTLVASNPDIVMGLDTHSCCLVEGEKIAKTAFSLGFLLFDGERANLSNYPTNDIWHYKNGKIVRVTKQITKES